MNRHPIRKRALAAVPPPPKSAPEPSPVASTSLLAKGDLNTAGPAELARTEAQAGYVLARQYPREMAAVRAELLARCENPAFADRAMYAKPMGRDEEGENTFVYGFSIRFVEAAMQCLGHMRSRAFVTHDTPERRSVRVEVVDLQKNNAFEADIIVEKTVERRYVAQGVEVLRHRMRRDGKVDLNVIEATDDEVRQKQNALVSMTVRNLGLRHLPWELQEEARVHIEATRAKMVAADPGGAVRRMVDAYARAKVSARELEKYLGHSLNSITEKEILEMIALSHAIAEKETTWTEALERKLSVEVEGTPAPAAAAAPAPGPGPAKTAGQAAAERIAARKSATPRTPSPAPRGSTAAALDADEDERP